jgi:GntR family transcriptional regulator
MNSDNTSIALYFRIAETLKSRIESKEYDSGSVIPSEKILAEEFGVSNITIRKAMSLLVEKGWVIRRRGFGTQVASRDNIRIPLKITGDFRDWIDSAASKNLNLKVEVLEVRIIPCPSLIAKHLSIPEGSDIWKMKRIRKRLEEPISYYINYAPPEFFQNIAEKEFLKKPFISVFQKHSGIQITKIRQQVEAGIADMDLAAILKIKFGDPLFFVENIYFSADGAPLLLTHIYFRGDRYVYQSQIRLY